MTRLEMAELIAKDTIEIHVSGVDEVTTKKDVFLFFEGEHCVAIANEFSFSKDAPTMCRLTDIIAGNDKIISNPYIVEADIIVTKTVVSIGGTASTPPKTVIQTRVLDGSGINVDRVKFITDNTYSEDLDVFRPLYTHNKLLYFGDKSLENELKNRNINKLQDKI